MSFWRAWITGSMNQKVSNELDHASGEIHKVAMGRMKADAVKARVCLPYCLLQSGVVYQCWTAVLEHGWRGNLTYAS